MRVSNLLFLFVCSLAMAKFVCPPNDGAMPPKKSRYVEANNNEAVVYVTTYCKHMCSGFVVGKDLVMTAAHCVEEDDVFTVHFKDGHTALSKVVDQGSSVFVLRDWAILKVDTKLIKPLKFADSVETSSDGLDLTYGGINKNREPHQYPVTIAGITMDRMGLPTLEVHGPIDHGDSGSAIVNLKGEVVGMASRISRTDMYLSWAVPVLELKQALEDYLKK